MPLAHLGLLAVALVELGLAALVLARGPHRPVNRWFAAFVGAAAVWAALVGVRRSLVDPSLTLFLVRLLFAVAALIPVTLFHFALVFPHPGPPNPLHTRAVTLAGFVMAGLSFSPWIVSGIRETKASNLQPVYGPIYPLFAVHIIAGLTLSLFHLARKLRHAKGSGRVQLQYLFVGTVLTCGGAVTTNIAGPLLFGTSHLGVYGPYFSLIWVGFTAHSIIRHRLMDIRIVVSRTMAYAAGWALMLGVVGSAVLFDFIVLDQDLTLSPVGAVLVSLGTAICFAALAPLLKRLADRYLYRPAYDSRQLVRDGSRAMGTVTAPESVASAMAGLIGRALKLESLTILVSDRERQEFQPLVIRHVDPGATWPRPLTAASPLVAELARGGEALWADDLRQRSPSDDVTAIGGDLRAWHAEVALPVRGDRELIALILAGPKLSGDPFFREDFELLETLASQLAVGLRNAQLYFEVVSVKEYHERILAHMDSGVIAVREDGIVTTFNPAAERITGLGSMLTVGRTLGVLDPALQGVLTDSLAGRQDAETEISVSHPDGRVLPLVTHTSALHDRHGSVRGAIAVFNDHSRLKTLEADKRRADRLTAIGGMATGIAHEIRNPLVAIKTFAELLPERADDQEFRSTFAKVAVREIHRIEELLARLRTLAIPAATRLYPLDLALPISETLDLIRGQADRRRVRVVTDIEPDIPAIRGEPDQLKQLFLNLFLNALEVMPDGGTLSVSVQADRGPKGRVLVTVRVTDTGPGIPREDLPRVFEPFFTTKTHGTGLGLAICRGIADAHQGALWAEAGPAGVGTAFVVQFPTLSDAPVAFGALR